MADVEPIFKKKARSRPTVQRKRALEEEEAPEASTSSAASEVVRVARTATGSPFVQGSTGLRRAKKARAGAVEVDEDEEEDHDIGVSFSARRDEPRRRSKSPTNDVLAGDEAIAEAEKGLYKGEKAYGSQLPKGSSRYGPIKGPENVRTITMMDYKPDICKDYKETGFCGFGDSCIFLHDRSDYLHGWQLDNMFISQQANAAKAPEPEEEEDELPFGCYICRETWDAEDATPPIVTRCGHFFHQKCALKRYAKNSKCAACGAATSGIFNSATKIFERAAKNKALRRKGEDGEEGGASDDEAGLNGVEGLAED